MSQGRGDWVGFLLAFDVLFCDCHKFLVFEYSDLFFFCPRDVDMLIFL